LASLQNLPFKPVAIAVLGLTTLTRAPVSTSTGPPAGSPGNPAACYVRPSLLGAAAADARHFALGAALLVDAAVQVSADSAAGTHRCRALL
jgi:hypothetical protein